MKPGCLPAKESSGGNSWSINNQYIMHLSFFWTGLTSCSWGILPPLVLKKNLSEAKCSKGLLQARPSCHPTNSLKELTATQGNEPNPWVARGNFKALIPTSENYPLTFSRFSTQYLTFKKVARTRLPSVRFWSWSRCLAVSLWWCES